MTLSERLSEYIAAAVTGLWIQSFEHQDAIAEIARLCQENDWRLAVWDIDRGLQAGGSAMATALFRLAGWHWATGVTDARA